MQIIRRLNTIILFCICSFYSYSEESLGGILFTSSAEKVDKRTSLVLFGNKLQKFENSFTIGFDLSIWDANQFGHIFRAINEQKQEVEFVFVNFYGIDSMYLDFHSPITHKSVQVPITKEDINKKKSLHLTICFDLKDDKASITVRDSTYTCAPIGLENPSFLQFTFGLYGLNMDVPQMLIGNLHIQEEEGKSFSFPLEESEGEFAYDKTGKVKARVKNPGWIINKHFYWQEKSSFRTSGKASVSFDEADNRIVINGGDSVLSYYPRYDRAEIAEIKSDVPVDEQHLLHSNVFYSSAGDLYQFGGYSNHSYSDRISRYDKETRQWEPVEFKGDRITPRFYSAVGDGVLPDEKLIFGGFGNETGKQEHSGHNLYDLYVLNLKQKTITNLWRLHEIPTIEFIPGNNLILSEDKKYFYAFCYAHHIPKTFGYLYRFDLQNGKYELVSDSINFSSEGMNNTSVNLFYNREMHEFYVVIRDFSDKNETRVLVYSLLSPSITKSQLENSAPLAKPYRILAWIAALIAFLIVAIVFLTRSITQKPEMFRLSREDEEDEYDGKIQKQSAVYVFGAFMVYDKKGVDITYRFSTKLKVLFSLILLNTKDETGISTEKLTQTLWPDKDVNEAKSTRGVTINRLRNILEDIGDIQLVHQNSQWFFTFNRSFYCDYLVYTGLLNRLQHADRESYPLLMEQLYAIVRNGSFLLSIHDAGIDHYKSKEEEKLERLLKEYILYLCKKKQYQKIISISATFFAIEPLNEEVLNICIKAYNKLGKKEEAKTFLKNYKRTYNVVEGEKYKMPSF
ncbi:MAG: hypothetical protein LBS08_04510 [Candidatus Symbiothrix sp.]|jgi:two-component SAPR family response regulator|nr:hypothetical protein [Candidatus Symbiothrix sp.]